MSEKGKELQPKKAQEILPVKITATDIKKYFCPLATEKELFMALGVINSLNLNPHTREVHLIKYKDTEKLSIIVGYEVFLKRAERSGKLDGWKCGISEDGTEAWVEIHRKDWKEPFTWSIKLDEFNKKQATWNQIPTFMAKKVAIAQGFRLAFPDELGGMPYTQEEQAVYDINPKEPEPDVPMPQSKSKKDEPALIANYEGQFVDLKHTLGDELYFKALKALGIKSAADLKTKKAIEDALGALRKEVEKNIEKIEHPASEAV